MICGTLIGPYASDQVRVDPVSARIPPVRGGGGHAPPQGARGVAGPGSAAAARRARARPTGGDTTAQTTSPEWEGATVTGGPPLPEVSVGAERQRAEAATGSATLNVGAAR